MEILKLIQPHLYERIRVIQNKPIRAKGDFILYWMHHAVRSHENPALNTALSVSAETELPVLVYQGLGGSHPYNSDRHHSFIMEGAREAQKRLNERGIAYRFYLGRQPRKTSPLQKLARRAALVITEEYPVPPFPKWTQMLASRVDTAIWVVDCACIIPMQSIKRSFSRAYAFRDRTQNEYKERLLQQWEDSVVPMRMFEGDCGFDDIDLTKADIADLCSQCEIDHTVPPVLHTPGGSSAGYARWEKFKVHGLRSYARLRNDASLNFPQGVSRLSPYLHHGHVSPFRIARDAAMDGSSGAMKFLDELLVWRELSHNFCFHHPYPENIDVLPKWARETLKKHQLDFRKTNYSWESLYRGKTGDVLWDTAQKSLLVHGELHNNVRMTWGKAILYWTPDSQKALDLMIDLNHRLALDGNDANSYGGLLWCLGLFDRPFKPERPLIGTLRPRSTKDHARRLDLSAYRKKVKRPTGGRPQKIAIIGAGISGLFAARTLIDHDHRVAVFEKNAGPGGRTATIHSSSFAFDAGAQYFTTRDDRLGRYVRSWHMDGIAEPWAGKIIVAKEGQLSAEKQMTKRWVGVPSMDSIAKHLSQDIDIRYNVTIESTQRMDGQWRIIDNLRNLHGPFDALIIAIPPPQSGVLIESSPELSHPVSMVEMQPCSALLAAFNKPLDVPFDAAFIHNSQLKWAARNNSKPQRESPECWVFHASSQWSNAHNNMNSEPLARAMLKAFFKSIGYKYIEPNHQLSIFWGSAIAENPLNLSCLWDAKLKIGCCGDWCQLSRFEGAALSGMAMAGKVLNAIARSEKWQSNIR